MAFPFLSEAGFETGTLGHFDAETDTESRLDFPHYSALAAVPRLSMPFRGAYCLRVNLANDGTPADAYVQETGSWDTAAAGTIFFRFMLWVSSDITMANNDEFAVLQLWSGASTVEGGVYINFTTANGLRLGIGETSATSFIALTTNTWHAVEAKFVIDSGVGDDGTIDAWLDNAALTQVTALDQGAITSGVVGAIGQDAGTTKGTILIDDIIADDARIFPPSIRFPTSQHLTTSGHAFVGPGEIDALRLLSGAATDNAISIFDTDVGSTSDAGNAVLELKNTANNEMVTSSNLAPIRVQRGCFVSMTGTNPRAELEVRPCPAWGSDGAIRQYGLRRKPTPGNV